MSSYHICPNFGEHFYDPKSLEGEQDNGDKLFEETVIRLFGDALREDENFCHRFWSSLANFNWLHQDGLQALAGLRDTVNLISKIRVKEECALYWYTFGSYGRVHSEIAAPLAEEGWTWEADEYGMDIVDLDIRNELTARDRVHITTDIDYFPEDRLDKLEKIWSRLTGGA